MFSGGGGETDGARGLLNGGGDTDDPRPDLAEEDTVVRGLATAGGGETEAPRGLPIDMELPEIESPAVGGGDLRDIRNFSFPPSASRGRGRSKKDKSIKKTLQYGLQNDSILEDRFARVHLCVGFSRRYNLVYAGALLCAIFCVKTNVLPAGGSAAVGYHDFHLRLLLFPNLTPMPRPMATVPAIQPPSTHLLVDSAPTFPWALWAVAVNHIRTKI